MQKERPDNYNRFFCFYKQFFYYYFKSNFTLHRALFLLAKAFFHYNIFIHTNEACLSIYLYCLIDLLTDYSFCMISSYSYIIQFELFFLLEDPYGLW